MAVIKFMGLPAPHLAARLNPDELIALKKELRDEELFLQRKAKWDSKKPTDEPPAEWTPPNEKPAKEFYWWPENPDDPNTGWLGRCAGKIPDGPDKGKACNKIVKAVGLVNVDGKLMWGKWKDAGHYCADCRPRLFGKVSGRRALGIPMWGEEDGSESET